MRPTIQPTLTVVTLCQKMLDAPGLKNVSLLRLHLISSWRHYWRRQIKYMALGCPPMASRSCQISWRLTTLFKSRPGGQRACMLTSRWDRGPACWRHSGTEGLHVDAIISQSLLNTGHTTLGEQGGCYFAMTYQISDSVTLSGSLIISNQTIRLIRLSPVLVSHNAVQQLPESCSHTP